jgi:hypothetical protein
MNVSKVQGPLNTSDWPTRDFLILPILSFIVVGGTPRVSLTLRIYLKMSDVTMTITNASNRSRVYMPNCDQDNIFLRILAYVARLPNPCFVIPSFCPLPQNALSHSHLLLTTHPLALTPPNGMFT